MHLVLTCCVNRGQKDCLQTCAAALAEGLFVRNLVVEVLLHMTAVQLHSMLHEPILLIQTNRLVNETAFTQDIPCFFPSPTSWKALHAYNTPEDLPHIDSLVGSE